MTDWQRIVSRNTGLVWQTVYRLLGNDADAADSFQETFVSALETSRRQAVRNWPALLRRIATCKALDCLRRRLRLAGRVDHEVQLADIACGNPGPARRLEAQELAARLRRALAALPPQQAEVFCLRHLGQMSYRRIARTVGLNTSNVGVLLHRSRHRLRELLSPQVVAANDAAEVSP